MSEQPRGLDFDRTQVRDDHERLYGLLTRLRAEPNREQLCALLRELPERLAEHFRHEEDPGGFYDAIGVSLPEARGEVGRLVDDHFRLVTMARDLAEAALAPAVATTVLREQAARVAGYLADHEQRESDLGRRLLEDA